MLGVPILQGRSACFITNLFWSKQYLAQSSVCAKQARVHIRSSKEASSTLLSKRPPAFLLLGKNKLPQMKNCLAQAPPPPRIPSPSSLSYKCTKTGSSQKKEKQLCRPPDGKRRLQSKPRRYCCTVRIGSHCHYNSIAVVLHL